MPLVYREKRSSETRRRRYEEAVHGPDLSVGVDTGGAAELLDGVVHLHQVIISRHRAVSTVLTTTHPQTLSGTETQEAVVTTEPVERPLVIHLV